uniref:Uncharacterized protein n=1 Tax=Cucumis melo TaxID=3656 RepID=A0A9I9DNC7_CUCME
MAKDQENATLVPIGLPKKEVLEEPVDDPLLEDKQIAFEDECEKRASSPQSKQATNTIIRRKKAMMMITTSS